MCDLRKSEFLETNMSDETQVHELAAQTQDRELTILLTCLLRVGRGKQWRTGNSTTFRCIPPSARVTQLSVGKHYGEGVRRVCAYRKICDTHLQMYQQDNVHGCIGRTIWLYPEVEWRY